VVEETKLEKIEGSVSSVIYRNEETGYSVLRLNVDDGSQAVVVGCIPMAAPGESITAYGRWTRHPAHGEQFKAEHTERVMPTGSEAIFDYLASRVVRGIGPATAALIVSEFGDSSLEVLRDHPEKLAQLRGLSEKKAREISEAFRRQTGLRTLMEFLGGAGLAPIMAIRLWRYYGENALDLLKENPYILATEHIGAAFSEADGLALSLGMEGDSPQRIAAALLFELRHNAANGHCFIPREKLVDVTARLVEVDADLATEGLEFLLDAGDVICEPVAGCDACYLAGLYAAETYTAERLRDMARRSYETNIDTSGVIEKIEGEQGIRFAPLQRMTLEAAASRQLVVITGGPGTGKTTSVRAVLELFDEMGLSTLLAAPTGRAVKRMTELTGRAASTIHKLLGASFSEETDSVTFRRCESDKLDCAALVLDECSMIDITLMKAVLSAIDPECRLILVGDVDQLPPVGPGNVFRDIIRSGAAQTVRLKDIFRQREESRIVLCAHQINSGEHPDLRQNSGGFYFLRRREPESAAAAIVELCKTRLPENMRIPVSDIQVLTPTRKGPAGTENLNRLLQEALNPSAPGKNEFTFAERVFREGDRVMQIRNDYDIPWHTKNIESGSGVFNGDIGVIASIDPAAGCCPLISTIGPPITALNR
jgi:exodeoxyribonuclease V alpha subunit